ncbi:MAG: hypothetical protein CMI54_04090 [Parcubacteria group bacterium]|nr:hypothetical protein [Parcubacteria group bacterium]|tara:strand:+ start:4647 stop:4868 length:222 start_codon:yes stop_codon:yes gene_type:complete
MIKSVDIYVSPVGEQYISVVVENDGKVEYFQLTEGELYDAKNLAENGGFVFEKGKKKEIGKLLDGLNDNYELN